MVLEHRRPVELRSEEAIRWDIKEHQRGRKESCDVYNQHCSDRCSLRSFLNWPKGIPLHDPQSFKALGDRLKELRESFVDAVYEMEIQIPAGPSPSVSSIWGLGKLVEPVHSASASGSLHVEVPPKTVSWQQSARSTAADPDTLSSISWWGKDGTRVEAPRFVLPFPVGEHDPHAQPNVGGIGKPPSQVRQLRFPMAQASGFWDPIDRRASFKVFRPWNGEESDLTDGQDQEHTIPSSDAP